MKFLWIIVSLFIIINQREATKSIFLSRKVIKSILAVHSCLFLFNCPIIPAQGVSLLPKISASERVQGSFTLDYLDSEAISLYNKAKQCENDGDFTSAQTLYEQIVVSYPLFSIAWADLGNVLTARGLFDQALLCYKKALSLSPSKDNIGIILVNKAVVEEALSRADEAIRDLDLAERISGPVPTVLTNRAVLLTNAGRWKEACSLFERVISSSDRDALPWWLKYSMALLETDRGVESVAFLQRTLNRFPAEAECKAFATALYSALGSPIEANRYWKQMSEDERKQYSFGLKSTEDENKSFVKNNLHWGPDAIQGLKLFLKSV
jgi:tetratricopeptide (TPR) repeat protein